MRQEEGEGCKKEEEDEEEEEEDDEEEDEEVGEDSVKWVLLNHNRPPVLERLLRALAGTGVSMVRAKHPVRFSFDSVWVE